VDVNNLTRRDFLKKSAGALGLLAALSSPVVPLLKKVKAAEDSSGTPKAVKTPRAWCMVIDLKKCEGCVTIDSPPQCTQSCITGHYIPKGQLWIEIFKVELSGGGSYFMPTPCFHCENAPCVNVCPVAATYHTEDGVVLIDQRRCIGCRMCMAACPYHRRFFNWGQPEQPPEAAFVEYSPEHQVPAIKGTVMKCDFCPDMMRNGKLPYCVTGCPMKALYMGDLKEDLASNGREVVTLSSLIDENTGYRYKESLGTQPRVWYLPGHGQQFQRAARDERELLPANWEWGGEGYNRHVSPGQWSGE